MSAFLDSLSEEEAVDWMRDWRVWGRDEQLLPDGIWTTALIHPGRGWGKTRCAVEFINEEIRHGRATNIAIVGQGAADIRKVMIEGISGFIRTARPGERPTFTPSVAGGRLAWPNGAVGDVVSAEDSESLRGPEYDLGWFDEPMAVPAAKRAATVMNLRLGLRLPPHPRLIYTTTPKPHRWIRDEIAKGKKEEHKPIHMRRYIMITGNTLDNADNLAASALEDLVEEFGGTNLGRQEMNGEVLGDEAGALWTAATLDRARVRDIPTEPEARLAYLIEFCNTCDKVVVGVDPNLSAATKTAHEAGIVVAARRGKQRYVAEDLSTKGGPAKWAAAAVLAFDTYGANEIVVEVNQGGDMCKLLLQNVAKEMGIDIAVRMVRATKGKQRRAEPVAAAYEQGKVQHLGEVGTKNAPGPFYKLETQMCDIHEGLDTTGEDFDRCDAAVWALTRLGLKSAGRSVGSMPAMMAMSQFEGANG